MKYVIYKITNTVNNKIYIGKHQTQNLDDGYMGSGKLIKRAIKKYRRSNFIKEILFIYDNVLEMDQKEIELVNENFINSPNTYNLRNGGVGGFEYMKKIGKYTHIDEARKIHMNKWKTDKQYKEKLADSQKSRPDFEIHLANMRKIFYERNPDGVWRGRKHKEETKIRIGKSVSVKSTGSNNSQFGTCWITNGEINKKILASNQIPNGFKRGRI